MPTEEKEIGHNCPAFSRIASALLLALAALWCLYWFVHCWHYWEDDAYIHLEFARSVATGQGFSFNGSLVSGDTAPLWVILLDGIHFLVRDWIAAGKVLTAIGTAFGLSGLYAFARSLLASRLRSVRDGVLFPAAMVLLIAVNPYFCYWAFSGMESVTAAGLGCWMVLAASHRPPSPQAFLTGCLLAGIAPLFRPEMVFLAFLLIVPLFASWRRLSTSSSSSGKAALFLGGTLLFSLPQILWSLYSLHAFGHLLPNTDAAKRAGPSASVIHRLLTVYTWAFPVIIFGLLAAFIYFILRPSSVRNSLQRAVAYTFRHPAKELQNAAKARESSPVFPLSAWIFALWFAITTLFYIANHTYVQTRYILVVAPGLTVVVMLFALRLSPRASRVLYVGALFSSVAISVFIVRPLIRNKSIDCEAMRDMALYMRDNIPSDAPVAVYSIGEIAFVSQHPIVDTGGITRTGAIPYLNDNSLDRMVRWARSQGAQYYIEAHRPEAGATPVYTIDTKYLGWLLDTSRYNQSSAVSLWKLPETSPSNEEPSSGN